MESVPGFVGPNIPRRAPRSPSYASLDQRAVFAAWLTQERERRGVSRKQLARKLWPTSSDDATTTRIKSYETVQHDERGRVVHVMLPSREVLRRICEVLDISWLSAFTSAGYYRDVLQALAALVTLGYRWLDRDLAFARDGAKMSFRSLGVTELDGRVVWDAMQELPFSARYISGSFLQLPAETQVVPETDVEGNPLPEIVRQAFAETRAPREQHYVVPKPMAVAILVAASGFPRRGDVWKPGADMYAVHVLEAATPLVDHALRNTKLALSGHLLRADEALRDARLPLDSRRVVAAEHMIAWADDICQGYTHCARLASFDYFGVSGSSTDKITVEYMLPRIRRAALPDVEAFRITENLD